MVDWISDPHCTGSVKNSSSAVGKPVSNWSCLFFQTTLSKRKFFHPTKTYFYIAWTVNWNEKRRHCMLFSTSCTGWNILAVSCVRLDRDRVKSINEFRSERGCGQDLNTPQVWYSSGHFECSDLEWLGPKPNTMDHPNTELVRYSSPHCTYAGSTMVNVALFKWYLNTI